LVRDVERWDVSRLQTVREVGRMRHLADHKSALLCTEVKMRLRLGKTVGVSWSRLQMRTDEGRLWIDRESEVEVEVALSDMLSAAKIVVCQRSQNPERAMYEVHTTEESALARSLCVHYCPS